MIKAILVPLDGSELAQRALPFAERVAAETSARLVLIQAVPDLSAAALAQPAAADALLEQYQMALSQTETDLSALAVSIGSKGLGVEAQVIKDDPAAAILRAIGKSEADLVVMSTHGRAGPGRWIYGSVADQVVRHSDVPVMLIPGAAVPGWPTGEALRVLVPLDGSELAEEALDAAATLAQSLRAQLALLRIEEPPRYESADGWVYVSYDEEGARAEAEEYLRSIAARLQETGQNATIHVATGFPTTTLAATAKELGAHLIVIASHGRGGLSRLLMGSVSTTTVQRATIPVVIVRPQTVRQVAAVAPTALVPVEPPKQAAITLELTAEELDVVARGLAELVYHPERDWRLAEPARKLMARLKQTPVAAARQH